MPSANSNGTPHATKAIVYCRFSPRRNGEECESNEVQLAYCRKLCAERGYSIIEEFEDRNAKGADENRPGLWAAVEAVRRGGVLVAYKYDRIARSVFLDEYIRREIEKKGARIEVVEGNREGDSPQDVLVRQILSAVAEHERKIIAARTSAAMRHYQKNGMAMGGKPPYGKQFGASVEIVRGGKSLQRRTLVDSPDEQECIAYIRALHTQGLAPNAITNRLNDEGILCRGHRFNHPLITRVCRKHTGSPKDGHKNPQHEPLD